MRPSRGQESMCMFLPSSLVLVAHFRAAYCNSIRDEFATLLAGIPNETQHDTVQPA